MNHSSLVGASTPAQLEKQRVNLEEFDSIVLKNPELLVLATETINYLIETGTILLVSRVSYSKPFTEKSKPSIHLKLNSGIVVQSFLEDKELQFNILPFSYGIISADMIDRFLNYLNIQPSNPATPDSFSPRLCTARSIADKFYTIASYDLAKFL